MSEKLIVMSMQRLLDNGDQESWISHARDYLFELATANRPAVCLVRYLCDEETSWSRWGYQVENHLKYQAIVDNQPVTGALYPDEGSAWDCRDALVKSNDHLCGWNLIALWMVKTPYHSTILCGSEWLVKVPPDFAGFRVGWMVLSRTKNTMWRLYPKAWCCPIIDLCSMSLAQQVVPNLSWRLPIRESE